MQRALESKVGFALLAGLYLLSFPYHPGLRSPNELCRLWQSRSLIDFGTLDINGTLSQLGAVGDLSCTAVVQGPDGQKLEPCVGPFAARAGVVARYYYPSKAPLVSFLGAPVYWVLKALGPVSELRQVLFSRLFVTVLPALGLLWLLRRFLAAYVSQPVADSLVVVYGLGTMAFAYAEAFMSHQLTAVLLFATFYVAWKTERGEWRERAYLLAGLLAGSVVAAEYTGALGVVCVAAYAVASRWKRWAALGRVAALVVAGAAPFLVALLAYHQACFGSPWTSGYKFLNNPSYQGWHEGGFLGIKGPDLLALWLSLFSPLRGLFTLSPFLLIAPFGFADVRAKDPALLVFLLVLVAGNLYFTASFSYASWGWTVGPRHLTPMVPFLMLPVALVVERLTSGAGGLGALARGRAVCHLSGCDRVGRPRRLRSRRRLDLAVGPGGSAADRGPVAGVVARGLGTQPGLGRGARGSPRWDRSVALGQVHSPAAGHASHGDHRRGGALRSAQARHPESFGRQRGPRLLESDVECAGGATARVLMSRLEWRGLWFESPTSRRVPHEST